jgi:hypothetical protein
MATEVYVGNINQYLIDEDGRYIIDELGNRIIASQIPFTISTPVCRRCGRAFPLTELTDGLCTDNNRYSAQGCMDEDENDGFNGEDD